MSRSMLILITDNEETKEKTKQHCDGSDCAFHSYTPDQWREGLDNNFFRQQLSNGAPPGTTGHLATEYTNNVVPFPGSNGSGENVQRMEDLEAKAIENAIMQYRGNLTEAAKALGIGRATLYRKVKQYHIDPSSARKRRMAA